MKKRSRRMLTAAAAICFILPLVGCTATTRTVSTDETIHYDESYDFADKKAIVDALVGPLLENSPVASHTNPPVIVIYGIVNLTSEHIDAGGISDDIREAMLKSGKVRFISKMQRNAIAEELDYQHASGMVKSESRIKMARQIGARYMLTGTLRSIEKEEPPQVRLKRKSLNYYSLHIELTDIETGLIDYADSVDLAREAAKPIIGW